MTLDVASRFAFLLSATFLSSAGCGGNAGDVAESVQATADAATTGIATSQTPLSPEIAARRAALDAVIADPNVEIAARREAAMERRELDGRPLPKALAASARRRKVDIEFPTRPPTGDVIEPGLFVLAIHLEFANGTRFDNRQAGHVDLLPVEGDDSAQRFELRFDASRNVYAGTLRRGRLDASGKEGDLEIYLSGQVVGPNKLVGTVDCDAPSPEMKLAAGLWSLERIR